MRRQGCRVSDVFPTGGVLSQMSILSPVGGRLCTTAAPAAAAVPSSSSSSSRRQGLPNPFHSEKRSFVIPKTTLDTAACRTPASNESLLQSTATMHDEAPQESTAASSSPSQMLDSSVVLMSGLVQVTLVGVVTNVQHGKLAGGVEVMQFSLDVRGYRSRQPGELKGFQNIFLVRARGPWVEYTVPEGSRVTVRGALSMHTTYDMVSKQNFENPIVDVGSFGYLGLL